MKKLCQKMLAALLSGALILSIIGIMPQEAYATSKNQVKKVTIAKPDTSVLVLKKGKSYKIKTQILPANAKNKKVSYKSSKKSVVSVSSKGVIKAKKKGTAKITVTSKQNKKKKDTLKVIVGTPVKSISLNYTELSLMVGETNTLRATVSPKKPSYKSLKWQSDNAEIVSVKDGVITAKAAGTAVVQVTSKDGSNKKAVCTVTVTEPAAPEPTPPPEPEPTPEPTPTPNPEPAPSPEPTPNPEPTPSPEPTPNPEPTPTPVSKWVSIAEILENDEIDIPYGYSMEQADTGYGEVVNISYESEATDSIRKAKVLLPEGYAEDKEYPVLYMMHGIGGDETSLLEIDNVAYTIGNAIASGDAEEMIVVFPNGCANETSLPPAGEAFYSLAHYQAYDNFVNDLESSLMPYMAENFSVAQGRENTAIAGFSMGGRVSLHVAFTLQDKIRYVGAFCPAFGILEYTNNGVHENGLFTESTFKLTDEYVDDTLIMIVAGPNDDIVRDEPKRYHNALTENEVPHMYYETLGGELNTGNGAHSADVYRYGLYDFMTRIFQRK